MMFYWWRTISISKSNWFVALFLIILSKLGKENILVKYMPLLMMESLPCVERFSKRNPPIFALIYHLLTPKIFLAPPIVSDPFQSHKSDGRPSDAAHLTHETVPVAHILCDSVSSLLVANFYVTCLYHNSIDPSRYPVHYPDIPNLGQVY